MGLFGTKMPDNRLKMQLQTRIWERRAPPGRDKAGSGRGKILEAASVSPAWELPGRAPTNSEAVPLLILYKGHLGGDLKHQTSGKRRV